MQHPLPPAMLCLVLALGLSSGPVRAGCLIFCDEETLTGASAERQLATRLGQPLPPGIAVTHLVEGGFQDGFVQIRVTADAGAAPALLALLGVDAAAMTPAAAGGSYGATQADWWQPGSEPALREGQGRLAGFAEVWVGLAQDDGTRAATIYIFAFET